MTAGALIVGVPIGILTAVFLAKYSPKKWYRILKGGVDLLAGIPSVVYGFFGLVVLVPMVRDTFGGNGNSILTASLLLGIMILPTIIETSEAAIQAVRINITKEHWRLVPRMREVFTVRLYRQRNPNFSRNHSWCRPCDW